MTGPAISSRDIRNCDLCSKPLCHTGTPLFSRVRIERMGVDLNNLRALTGLTMMLGNQRIAEAFAPSTDIAKPLGEPEELLICEHCAIHTRDPILALAEIACSRREAREEAKAKGAAA